MSREIEALVAWIDENIEIENIRQESSKFLFGGKVVCVNCGYAKSLHLDLGQDVFKKLVYELGIVCDESKSEEYYHYEFKRNGCRIVALFESEVDVPCSEE